MLYFGFHLCNWLLIQIICSKDWDSFVWLFVTFPFALSYLHGCFKCDSLVLASSPIGILSYLVGISYYVFMEWKLAWLSSCKEMKKLRVKRDFKLERGDMWRRNSCSNNFWDKKIWGIVIALSFSILDSIHVLFNWRLELTF
jgi:hypothetical protein